MLKSPYFEIGAAQSVKCTLCNHFCTIANGQRGRCGVRENENGEMISLVYGHPAATNIDPIEKKPLFHFLPGTKSFSLGTLGCNFLCANCQNWDISQADQSYKPDENLSIAPEQIIKQAIASGCPSISYTYNEPTIFTEYALDIMRSAKEKGLKNIWVSNGYMSDDCLNAILPYLDAINVDLKSFSEDFYQKNCGASLKPILINLKKIKQSGTHLEITTLIIPGLSDDIAMLSQIINFIISELGPETPWHISRFSSSISWKLTDLPNTNENYLEVVYELANNQGLKYVYIGNIPNSMKENTFCPVCRELIIKRIGFGIKRHDNNGKCPKCGLPIPVID